MIINSDRFFVYLIIVSTIIFAKTGSIIVKLIYIKINIFFKKNYKNQKEISKKAKH